MVELPDKDRTNWAKSGAKFAVSAIGAGILSLFWTGWARFALAQNQVSPWLIIGSVTLAIVLIVTGYAVTLGNLYEVAIASRR
ncbi:hypothetical protein ACFPYI_21015 [Halomarina salina]|uniref:Uncharacterized protein n=1 Tax=Halomarina salina TaxID=1872699 RepID=A0ABD5RTX1_9EURY|nr:hypothetical protein [Halomarina salina]